MNKLFLPILILIVSCSSQKLSQYNEEEPKINIQDFFNGNIKALGIVQDRSGSVISRFKVDIKAHWVKNVGTLDETFNYSDNTTSKRIWTLTRTQDDNFIGEAGDVTGKARGKAKGNTFFFEYTLQVPFNGSIYDIHVEDWMYLLDEKTLLGRSYMTKFGFDVGEVTLVMTKEGSK
jgi:hypothetical protein